MNYSTNNGLLNVKVFDKSKLIFFSCKDAYDRKKLIHRPNTVIIKKINLKDLSNHLLVTSGPHTKFLTVSVTVSSAWTQSS